MQMLMSRMRAAMEKYRMVSDGDRIAVGVSGGKDSLVMLAALNEMRRFYPKKFEMVAITVDPCFNNIEGDFSKIAAFCESIGVEYSVKRTKLFDVVFNQRREKNPCSLCAKMRRGMLHDAAIEAGCNKVALGHHLDDAVVTFYMNLLDGGSISCFSPVSYLSRKQLTLIRPMVFSYEKEIAKVAGKLELPIVGSACPADGTTERAKIGELIKQLEKQNGFSAIYEKTLGALQRGHISGWGIETDK